MDETERMMKAEKKKYEGLIESAQNELDRAELLKAPKEDIKHLEHRVKSLAGHLKKIVVALSKDVDQEKEPMNAATPCGKKGAKKKKGE